MMLIYVDHMLIFVLVGERGLQQSSSYTTPDEVLSWGVLRFFFFLEGAAGCFRDSYFFLVIFDYFWPYFWHLLGDYFFLGFLSKS